MDEGGERNKRIESRGRERGERERGEREDIYIYTEREREGERDSAAPGRP